jgi:hypothetical protein
MKNSNDTIQNRSCDPQICSSVPQPLCHRVSPAHLGSQHNKLCYFLRTVIQLNTPVTSHFASTRQYSFYTCSGGNALIVSSRPSDTTHAECELFCRHRVSIQLQLYIYIYIYIYIYMLNVIQLKLCLLPGRFISNSVRYLLQEGRH